MRKLHFIDNGDFILHILAHFFVPFSETAGRNDHAVGTKWTCFLSIWEGAVLSENIQFMIFFFFFFFFFSIGCLMGKSISLVGNLYISEMKISFD